MKEKDCSYLRHIALKQELIDRFSLSYLLKALSFNLCDCGDPFLFIIDISYIFYLLNSSNHII